MSTKDDLFKILKERWLGDGDFDLSQKPRPFKNGLIVYVKTARNIVIELPLVVKLEINDLSSREESLRLYVYEENLKQWSRFDKNIIIKTIDDFLDFVELVKKEVAEKENTPDLIYADYRCYFETFDPFIYERSEKPIGRSACTYMVEFDKLLAIEAVNNNIRAVNYKGQKEAFFKFKVYIKVPYITEKGAYKTADTSLWVLVPADVSFYIICNYNLLYKKSIFSAFNHFVGLGPDAKQLIEQVLGAYAIKILS